MGEDSVAAHSNRTVSECVRLSVAAAPVVGSVNVDFFLFFFCGPSPFAVPSPWHRPRRAFTRKHRRHQALACSVGVGRANSRPPSSPSSALHPPQKGVVGSAHPTATDYVNVYSRSAFAVVGQKPRTDQPTHTHTERQTHVPSEGLGLESILVRAIDVLKGG